MSNFHSQRIILVCFDLFHASGRRRGTQVPVWQGLGGRLLAFCRPHARDLHRELGRVSGELFVLIFKRALSLCKVMNINPPRMIDLIFVKHEVAWLFKHKGEEFCFYFIKKQTKSKIYFKCNLMLFSIQYQVVHNTLLTEVLFYALYLVFGFCIIDDPDEWGLPRRGQSKIISSKVGA